METKNNIWREGAKNKNRGGGVGEIFHSAPPLRIKNGMAFCQALSPSSVECTQASAGDLAFLAHNNFKTN